MSKLFKSAALLAALLFSTQLFAADSTAGYRISTASTNAVFVQAGVTRITALAAINTSASLAYLHIYDVAASASLACSNTTEVAILPIPASATGAGFLIPLLDNMLFKNGFGFCITGAGASGDTTNAPAGAYVNYLYR